MKRLLSLRRAAIAVALFTLPAAAQLPDGPRQISPILIGETAPGGVWQNQAGEEVDLGALLDARPTVLVFYRAHW